MFYKFLQIILDSTEEVEAVVEAKEDASTQQPVVEEANKVEVEIVDVKTEPVKEEPPEEDQVKDSWDAESSGEEEGI